MNKEEIYDSQIEPLMAKIIEICRANNIGMLASYAIPTPDDEGLHCTTKLPDESGKLPESLRDAARCITSAPVGPMMITTHRRDGTKTITAVLG